MNKTQNEFCQIESNGFDFMAYGGVGLSEPDFRGYGGGLGYNWGPAALDFFYQYAKLINMIGY